MWRKTTFGVILGAVVDVVVVVVVDVVVDAAVEMQSSEDSFMPLTWCTEMALTLTDSLTDSDLTGHTGVSCNSLATRASSFSRSSDCFSSPTNILSTMTNSDAGASFVLSCKLSKWN